MHVVLPKSLLHLVSCPYNQQTQDLEHLPCSLNILSSHTGMLNQLRMRETDNKAEVATWRLSATEELLTCTQIGDPP